MALVENLSHYCGLPLFLGTVEAYSLADALAEYLDVEFSVVDENDDRTFLVFSLI